MPVIKGGIKIRPNSDNKEFFEKLSKAGVKLKVPFTATGFKATRIPKGLDMSGVEFADDKKIIKSIKTVTEKKNDLKKNQEKISNLTKINGIGKKTVLDLQRHYNNQEELIDALRRDKVSLRDDQVKKLKEYFNVN